MKVIKTLEKVVAGICTCCALVLFSPNSLKEADMPYVQVSYAVENQAQKPAIFSSEAGALTVKNYKEKHDKAIDQKGIGLFYGSQSHYKVALDYGLKPNQALAYSRAYQKLLKMKDDEGIYTIRDVQKAALEAAIAEEPVSKPGFKLPVKTDCLEWCVLNLKESYKKSVGEEGWLSVNSIALEKSRNAPTSKLFASELGVKMGMTGMIGVGLAGALSEDGWVGVYYNPDTVTPADKPVIIPPKPQPTSFEYMWEYETELSIWHHFQMWVEHNSTYKTAKERKDYYGIPITDLVVDYRPTTELTNELQVAINGDEHYKEPVTSPTIKKKGKIEQLKKVPFGFLVARGGQHCAIISYGKVYEVHFALEPTKKELIDVKDFETEWDWLSGIIMIPPGVWK